MKALTLNEVEVCKAAGVYVSHTDQIEITVSTKMYDFAGNEQSFEVVISDMFDFYEWEENHKYSQESTESVKSIIKDINALRVETSGNICMLTGNPI